MDIRINESIQSSSKSNQYSNIVHVLVLLIKNDSTCFVIVWFFQEIWSDKDSKANKKAFFYPLPSLRIFLVHQDERKLIESLSKRDLDEIAQGLHMTKYLKG